LYHLAVAAGNVFQRSNLDPVLCHTRLPKEQPGVLTSSQALASVWPSRGPIRQQWEIPGLSGGRRLTRGRVDDIPAGS
jgi:hypothetical protein